MRAPRYSPLSFAHPLPPTRSCPHAHRKARRGSAALDVFEVEPLPASSPLWDCGDRLLLTAHNADYTDDYFQLGWRVWQSNLEAHLRGEPMKTPVDKTAGY